MRKSVTRSALSLTALGAVLMLLQGTPAKALNNKSYVSNTGTDAGTCATVATACASFQFALGQTAPGGEITVVNTGDYGGTDSTRLAISQSVNITNDGAGEASILVPQHGLGININAGVGDFISLRGLVIDGQFGASGGIQIQTGEAVHIQNCVIRSVQSPGNGIDLVPQGNTELFVSDTIIYNNGSAIATGGIKIMPVNTGSATVVLDRVHLENNVRGLQVIGQNSTGNGAHVVIRDSVVSGNAAQGILAFTLPGQAPAFIVVERTSVVNNAGTGILAQGPGATMLLNDNTVARNGEGISASNSGQLISYGNNKVNNNLGADGVPTGSRSPI